MRYIYNSTSRCIRVLFILLLPYAINSNAQGNSTQAPTSLDSTKYYRRHIIICIDQTTQDRTNNFANLYSAFEALILNQGMPSGISEGSKYVYKGDTFFDPRTDELSVLVNRGLSGDGISWRGDYAKIHSLASKERLSDIIKAVDTITIRFHSSFRKSDLSISEFLTSNVKPLFVKRNDNYTRNTKYIYPLVLNHINADIPASEYVIIIASDFTGAANKQLKEGDETNFKTLLQKNYSGFEKYINSRDASYNYNSEMILLYFSTSGVNDYRENPKIKGGELTFTELYGTSFEPNQFELIQKHWKGVQYEIKGAGMHVTNNKQIQITGIEIEVADSLGNCIKRIPFGTEISRKNDKIELDALLLDFQDIEIDNLSSFSYTYVIYTSVKDKDGNELIPIVITRGIHPKIIMATEPRPWLPTVIGCFALALLGLVLRFIYVQRGKKNIPNIDIDVIPISNTRYMSVERCEVKNYDCWYMEDENDKLRKIRFKIFLTPHDIHFAKKHRFAVKFQVTDTDHNKQFSFKPSGKANDGNDMQPNTLYPIQSVYETKNNNSFESNIDVDAYIDTADKIDFSIDNILSMKLTIRLYLQENGSERAVKDGGKDYSFIVKPKLRNSNIWTAFDAGTSGATVAYGITGNWLDQDDINLVHYKKQEAGSTETKQSAIYPSVVSIPDESKAFVAPSFKMEDYKENIDFLFGDAAEKESYNKFQSIKKFLGYKSPQVLHQRNGNRTSTITGQDLAHLLVKGMYGQFEKTVKNNKNDDIREQFYNNGIFDPQRAIVAVPNNYTLNKVQDMVNSVKRLNVFKEVHYLYESEGVMMTYLRNSLPILKDKQDHTFVVFDMGGATINITAFGLVLRLGNNGNIRKITLTSLAKIGYFVGGDDIDYALIQFIYSIPSVKTAIHEHILKDSVDSLISQEDILNHQKAHKNDLIDFARKIKLDWIDVKNGTPKSDNIMGRIEDFWMNLRSRISDVMSIDLPVDPSIDDVSFIRDEMKHNNLMNRHVFSNISDALMELLRSPNFPPGTPIELILSGRSILYPGVKETILKSFKGRNISLWEGFYKKGTELFDDQKVKTAVAEGTCWFAMYSRNIELQHNYITSSFGFEDRINNQKCYHELIRNGREFKNGICRQEITDDELNDPNLNDIKFLQLMGHDGDSIVKNNIHHKKNLLDEVKPDQIKTAIEKIIFTVDDKGNYEYEIFQRGFEKAITREITRAFRQDKEIQNEIKDENSPAYEFATTNTSLFTSDSKQMNKRESSGIKSQQLNKSKHGLK